MNCTHPNHKDGVSCEDYAVACSKACTCCLTPEWFESQKFAQIFADAIQAAKDGKGLVVPSGDVMKKITMTIDEAIEALNKAKQEVGNATLILVLPDYGLATNVV